MYEGFKISTTTLHPLTHFTGNSSRIASSNATLKGFHYHGCYTHCTPRSQMSCPTTPRLIIIRYFYDHYLTISLDIFKFSRINLYRYRYQGEMRLASEKCLHREKLKSTQVYEIRWTRSHCAREIAFSIDKWSQGRYGYIWWLYGYIWMNRIKQNMEVLATC